ncbi:MAG TPA: NAD-dependent epimerase/dehydratase family protein [Bdellovibrionales bacterium]|nr:NAD-dependent epimerase/dehydratase family protein [Bdellovibrionales bacterium]
MKVLVTGATGLLGSHLVEQGLARGHQIRAVVRTVPNRSFLAGNQNRVELVTRDLANESLSADDFTGIDVVIHSAALASADPSQQTAMALINDQMPRKLYAQAENAGVRKWVQVSTTAVLTNAQKPIFTEEDFGNVRDTAYARTKYDFDQFLLKQKTRMTTLSVHPGYMLGRWDAKPSSGAILFGLRMGRFKHYIESEKNFVAAKDVAIGIWQAIEADAVGRYILGGHNSKISTFLGAASSELGMPFSAQRIENGELDRLTEGERSFVREFCSSGAVSHDKAQREFNYSPMVSISDMITETMDYFIENRMLKRASSHGSDGSRI